MFREEGASLTGAYISVGLELCVRYFLSCCGVPNKSNVGKDCFGSRFKDRVHHGSRCLRSLVCTGSRERWINAGTQLMLSFLFSPGPQPMS